MELYLEKVYPEKIIIIGKWASGAVTLARSSVPSRQTITLSTQYQKCKLSTTHQDTTTHTHKG